MTKNQTILIGVAILSLIAVIVYYLFFADTKVAQATNNNVTICHRTGNGWVKITVDDDAVNGQGNGDHNSSQHQNGQDIIPPGYWDQNGRNWATGQTIWNNDCNEPQPSVSSIPSITPYSSVTPSVEPTKEPEVTVEPTVTQAPSPTNTPEVKQDVSDNRSDGRSDGLCSKPPCVDNRSGVPLYKETINK